MALIAYPSPARHDGDPLLQPIVAAWSNPSELTGARQAIDLGYSWHLATVTTARMSREDARRWRLFFGRLRGTTNTFRLPVSADDQHAGTFTVRARGAGSGYSLETDGWPVSTTILEAGDYVTVGDQLIMLDADVTSDASGIAPLAFHAQLRGTVADNTIITTKRPYLLAHLPQNSPALGLNLARLQEGFSFEAREAY